MKDFKQLYNRILVINVVLFLGVIALFVLHFTSGSSSMAGAKDTALGFVSNDTSAMSSQQIAVVKLDTLLMEYELAQDLNENLLEKQKNAEAHFQSKMVKFQKDYTNFEEKARVGGFLSQASMEAQQQDLMKQQNDLQVLQESLSMQLAQDQEAMTQRLYDSVINNIQIINQDRFVLILGDAVGTNVLYSDKAMDITREVLSFLNSRYQSPNED